MTQRIPFSDMEWRGKPVSECSRTELLELVEVLYSIANDSAQISERLIDQQFKQATAWGAA